MSRYIYIYIYASSPSRDKNNNSNAIIAIDGLPLPALLYLPCSLRRLRKKGKLQCSSENQRSEKQMMNFSIRRWSSFHSL
eukprot:gene4928-3539_t